MPARKVPLRRGLDLVPNTLLLKEEMNWSPVRSSRLLQDSHVRIGDEKSTIKAAWLTLSSPCPAGRSGCCQQASFSAKQTQKCLHSTCINSVVCFNMTCQSEMDGAEMSLYAILSRLSEQVDMAVDQSCNTMAISGTDRACRATTPGRLQLLWSGCTRAKGRQVDCGLSELAYSCSIS